MAVNNITQLTLDYQDYLAYLNTNLTIAVSFFIAFFSYIVISIDSLNLNSLFLLFLVIVFIEVLFIAIHFWIYQRKEYIKYLIIQNSRTETFK